MPDDQFSQSLERIIDHLLKSAPHLARDIAIVARRIADAADRILSDTGPVAGVEEAQPVSEQASATLSEGAGDMDAVLPEPSTPDISSAPPSQSLPANPQNAGPLTRSSSAIVPVRIGDSVAQHIRVPGTTQEFAAARQAISERPAVEHVDQQFQPPDLELIAKRCELKAEACSVALDERESGADQQRERRQTVIERARNLEQCYLWPFNRDKRQPDDEWLRVGTIVYKNLADAARLCARLPRSSRQEHRLNAFQLLAEAQSALRAYVEQTWLTRPDADQADAFQYLRESAEYESIYVPRHMRLDDPADPKSCEDLSRRLAGLAKELDASEGVKKKRASQIKTLRYHAKLVQNAASDARGHQWRKIEDALVEYESLGGSIRDYEIASALEGVASYEIPPESVRTRAAMQPLVTEKVEDRAKDYSPTVASVRKVLEGGRIVIVGGERRQDAIDRYVEAFGCSDVEWVSLTEHGTTLPAQPHISRPGTRAVFLLIRLTGHLHTEDIARYCDNAGVPLIRLPAGYNPEQAAAQVVEQVSERLGLGRGVT